jgi:tetratricopeptide (TPR) repeat protein
VNFGHNRTLAIQLAKGKADYILIMDADMVANVKAPFKHKLTADWYEIRYEGAVDYSQTMLVSDRHEWSYVGITHEYIHSPTSQARGTLPALTLTHFADGGMRTYKFERDIRLLAKSVAENPESARDTFYLAQSYFDIGNYEQALEWYRRRASMEGWDQERWFALYRIAEALERMGRPWETVAMAYMDAFNFRPSRLEPMYKIVKRCREAGDYELGYECASAMARVPYPMDTLFIDRAIYEYLFPLELGVCAHGTGRFSEAVAAFDQVLTVSPLPDWAKESALRGRKLAFESLRGNG